MYENLNLRAWPFQTVPDPEYARVWAGRKQTKTQLDLLFRKMQIAPRSSLYLLWANFGMGKTHTLLHLQHLCTQTHGLLIPAYTVMPNKPGSFLDVYREIVASLPFEYLGEQLVKVGGGSLVTNPLFNRSPGVVAALLALRKGEIETSTAALQWLKAQPGLSAFDMRRIGVSYRIKTAEDAIHTLTTLTRLAIYRKPNARLVVLIDEFQRIGELKTSARNEINAGLHAYFNANPSGLSIMLSFSFGKKENVSFLLSNELKSRAEPESISLDVMSPGDAGDFLGDLLAQFRLKPDDRWAYPFSHQAVNAIIRHISQRKMLTPRRVMLYANHVLTSHVISRPDAEKEISAAEALEYLAQPELGEIDLDQD